MKLELLPYQQIYKQMQTHPIRQTEIPIEHSITLPLPTNRWKVPAYAFFASPVIRTPSVEPEQAPPDMWWITDAYTGRLLLYSKWSIMPFIDNVEWQSQKLPTVTKDVSIMQKQIEELIILMNTTISGFFGHKDVRDSTRSATLELLLDYIPEPITEQYNSLVPDFFEWLHTGNQEV